MRQVGCEGWQSETDGLARERRSETSGGRDRGRQRAECAENSLWQAGNSIGVVMLAKGSRTIRDRWGGKVHSRVEK